MKERAVYPRPQALVETAWLVDRLEDPDTRVVDMGSHEGYLRAHIPGAVHPGPGRSNFLKDPADSVHVLPPEAFAGLMARMGIGDSTEVVAYDAEGGYTAARLWWVMRYYGNDRCRVLNGGWNKWLAEGRSVSMAVPSNPARVFTPRVSEGLICRADGLKAAIGQEGVALLDVRSDTEWDGSNLRGNRRSGRVPGAVHLEWRRFVTDDGLMTFKPAQEIRKLLGEAGVTPDRAVLVY